MKRLVGPAVLSLAISGCGAPEVDSSSMAVNRDITDWGKFEAEVLPGTQILDSEGRPLGFSACPGSRPCKLEFQGLEIVEVPGTRLYWNRAARTDTQSGQIDARSIIGRPPAHPTGDRAGNGGHADPTGERGVIVPARIPHEMRYHGVQDRADCFSFRPYGTPGVTEESNNASYTMLVWSVPNRLKGGLNRRVLRAGQPFEFTGLEQRMPSYAPGCSARNGEVVWMYVRVVQNNAALFGWAVKEHTFQGQRVVHWAPPAKPPIPPETKPPVPPETKPPVPPGMTPPTPTVHHCSVRCRNKDLFDRGNLTKEACHQQYPVCENRGKVCRIKWGDVYITENSGC